MHPALRYSYYHQGESAVVPSNSVLPVISGTVEVGETLSTTDGTWTGTEPITYTYQWKRDGVNISGETDSTYIITVDDVGSEITVTVTGTNDVGSDSATSAATTEVVNRELFWIRGDDVVLAGSEITQANDKSPIGTNDAVAVGGRNTPNRLAADVNSRDVIDFNSTNTEILSVAGLTGITTYTMYLVIKADAPTVGSGGSVISMAQNGSGTFINQGFNLFIQNSLIQVTHRDGSGAQQKTFAFTDTASYHILMVKFQSNGAGLSKLIVKLDAVTKADFINLNSMVANDQNFYIGSVGSPGTSSFNGKIAEIRFFNTYHSDAQQEIIHNELSTYYNLGVTYHIDGYTGAEVVTSFRYSSSIDAITNLYARASFEEIADQPIAVIMHGFVQAASNFTDATLIRFKDYGWFAVAVGMRGRDSASGANDASAREMYDIYDAIQHIRSTYSEYVDADRVAIIGYSGGGGNVLGFISRFPDLPVLAVDFFGISDYGYDGTFSYHAQIPAQQANVETAVGGTPASLPNEYKAREHRWSASNFKGKLRIYHDTADASVLVSHSQRTVTQLIADGFTNYVYNESTVGSPDRWTHGLPNTGESGDDNIPAEADFSGEPASLPLPTLADTGTLKINGGVQTSLFRIWLGNGTAAQDTRNRRGTVAYDYTNNSYTVTPLLDSPATDMTVEIEILSGVHVGKTATGTISSATEFNPA
jgi:pimeloyl-ACP methyl ester carboxylesterase